MKQERKERRDALKKSCQPIHGHGYPNAVAELARTAAWCSETQVHQDVYGEGELIEGFEGKLATLFGCEAARFLPSGTMAQGLAMRIWCGSNGHFGMHPSSHLELHEERGYSHLFGLRATLVGRFAEEMLPRDVAAICEPLQALLIELPTRENGGRLPTWDQLLEICSIARKGGMKLHLDGARVWQAQVAYQKSYAEIGELFDSIYISFYKGIGALSGSMLLGSKPFIAQARLWQRRMGGNLYTLLPNVASAASRFDSQLERFPAFRERTLSLAQALKGISGLQLLPDPPQTSMLHVLLDLDAEAAELARDRVAEESGLWLFGGVRPGEHPDQSRFELSIGEATMSVDNERVASAFRSLLRS